MPISCTAADLAAASKCLCGIASPADRQRVMIYLLQHIAGLDNLTPAELVARSKCLCGIPENRLKAVEVALLCAATGGVPPCPPCPPGGNCTYQDMQVAWTPTNLKLSENLGLFTFGGFVDPITALTIDCAVNCAGFDLESTPLVSLGFPNLTAIDPTNTQGGYFFVGFNASLATLSAPALLTCQGNLAVQTNAALLSLNLSALSACASRLNLINNGLLPSITLPSLISVGNDLSVTDNTSLITFSAPLLATLSSSLIFTNNGNANLSLPSLTTALSMQVSGNPNLATVFLPLYLPTNNNTQDFSANALSVASVNHILARCVANAGFVLGTVNLSGQTPAAPPSGQGINDKATLIGRGVIVNTD